MRSLIHWSKCRKSLLPAKIPRATENSKSFEFTMGSRLSLISCVMSSTCIIRTLPGRGSGKNSLFWRDRRWRWSSIRGGSSTRLPGYWLNSRGSAGTTGITVDICHLLGSQNCRSLSEFGPGLSWGCLDISKWAVRIAALLAGIAPPPPNQPDSPKTQCTRRTASLKGVKPTVWNQGWNPYSQSFWGFLGNKLVLAAQWISNSRGNAVVNADSSIDCTESIQGN